VFGLKSKKIKENLTTTPPNQSAATPVWGQIYAMPVSYQASAPQESWMIKYWWVGALLAVVAAAGLGIYFLLRTPSAVKLSDLPQPPLTNSEPEVTSPTNTSVAQPTTPTVAATPAERDRQRYRDIKNIQAALELYKAEQKHYPLSLQTIDLGSDPYKVLAAVGFTRDAQPPLYLDQVPTDPLASGTPYRYQSQDGESYTITFTLEEGVAGLAAGEQKATPLGIGITLTNPTATPRSVIPPALTTDSDSDGLTDLEEPLLGTDSNKPDSDGDGYLDGSEVTQGYDPAKAEGAKLEQSSSLAWYHNDKFSYKIFYPVAWLAKSTDTDQTEVIFSGAAGEFVEVLVVDNPAKLSAADWYAKQVPGLTAAEVPTITLGSVTWAESLDGLNLYTTVGSALVTLSYNIGTRTQASYYHIFQAMARSFTLLNQPSVIVPPTTNNSSQPSVTKPDLSANAAQ